MKIGNVVLENNVFLAPMAGITDMPFRLLCKQEGCGLVYTEMVSGKALYYKDKKTQVLLDIHEKEKPVAVQIFGSEPDILAKIAGEAAKTGASIIDINMGCPTPKIIKNGDGAALMRDPKRIGAIVKAVSQAISIPVTIKIRKGWDEQHVNATEVAAIAAENGAKAITVHGRTREQFYTGMADWDIIKRVKQAVDIPVIGNGDITTAERAKEMLDYTGCDGIMIGRASRGNPWIFSQVIHYLQTGKLVCEPTPQQRIDKAISHMHSLVDYKGEHVGIREARKHIAWYIKGLKHAAKMRNEVNQAENMAEMEKLLKQLG